MVAIDNEPLAIAAARDFFQTLPPQQASRIHLLHADMEHLPFHDASFSKISFSEVIEHLVHPLPVLRELYRVLKPGGHLVLTTWPNKAHYLWRLKYWIGMGSKEDFNPQTRRSLVRLVRQTPFQLADFRFANFYLHIPKTPVTIDGWGQTSGLAQWCERSLVRGWVGNVFGSSLYARFVKPE